MGSSDRTDHGQKQALYQVQDAQPRSHRWAVKVKQPRTSVHFYRKFPCQTRVIVVATCWHLNRSARWATKLNQSRKVCTGLAPTPMIFHLQRSLWQKTKEEAGFYLARTSQGNRRNSRFGKRWTTDRCSIQLTVCPHKSSIQEPQCKAWLKKKLSSKNWPTSISFPESRTATSCLHLASKQSLELKIVFT